VAQQADHDGDPLSRLEVTRVSTTLRLLSVRLLLVSNSQDLWMKII